MNKPLNVDYDAKYDRFLISCPIWANDILRSLPSKRWNKKYRAWAMPPVKQNLEVLTTDLKDYTELTKAAANEILRLAQARQTVVVKSLFPTWYKFKTEPMPHQMEGLNHLYGLKAHALHMDRGTGKTKTEIDMMCALRMEGKIEGAIVICKLSLRHNWVREFDTHAPIPVSVHLPDTGSMLDYDKWLRRPHDFKVLVIGWESLSQGGMHKIAERFALAHTRLYVVGDETHMISNHRAIRSERAVALARAAEYRGGMTGTPISTGPMNLYMQYEFLDPDIIGIGDFWAFRNRYAVMGGYQNEKGHSMEIVGYQNIDELTKLVAPHTYQVDKSVLKLPPKLYKVYYVKMTPAQKAMYDKIRKEKAYDVGGTGPRIIKNALELALRLHQVAQGHLTKYTPEQKVGKDGVLKIKERGESVPIMAWDENPKIREVAAILSEKLVPTVIWYNYNADCFALADMLIDGFPKVRYGIVSGAYTEAINYATIRRFQAGELDILIVNTGVGGTGHDMFRAELMIYFNNNERLVDRLQSEDRAHRKGLDHPVLYLDIVMEKTVDVTIIKSIENKMSLSDYIRSRIGDLVKLLIGE